MNSLYKKIEYSELFKYSKDFEEKFCHINNELNSDYYFVIPKLEYNGISLENILINKEYQSPTTPLSTPRSTTTEENDEENNNNETDKNIINNETDINIINNEYDSSDSSNFNTVYNSRGGSNNINNKPSVYKLKSCIDNSFITLFERNVNSLLEKFISLSCKDEEISELFKRFKDEFDSKYSHIIRNKKETNELTIFLQNIHHKPYEELSYTQRIRIVSILWDYTMNMKDFAKLITTAVYYIH